MSLPDTSINTNANARSNAEVVDVKIWNSNIKFLPNQIFEVFVNLKSVLCNGNNLQSLRKEHLKGARKLEWLILENNKLTILRANAFEEAPTLYTISMEFNRISVIEDLAFSGLSKLRELSLKNNRLKSITGLTFFGLEKLTYLHLDNNQIDVIDDNSFGGYREIIQIDLEHNICISKNFKAFKNWQHGPELYKTCNSSNTLRGVPTGLVFLAKFAYDLYMYL